MRRRSVFSFLEVLDGPDPVLYLLSDPPLEGVPVLFVELEDVGPVLALGFDAPEDRLVLGPGERYLRFGFWSSSSEAEGEVECAFLLEVVVGEGSAVLQLLRTEDQPLLIGGDFLSVLYLQLDVGDGGGGCDVEGYRLSGEGLDENLHGDGVNKKDADARCALTRVGGRSSRVALALRVRVCVIRSVWDETGQSLFGWRLRRRR